MKKEIYDPAKDPDYQKPVIDAEEEKERALSDGRHLPYTYMHGHFEGTGVKFIFCFPPQENFKGRFFQYLSPFPGPDEEMVPLGKTGLDDEIAFAISHGAYYVESNMGSKASFGDIPDPQRVWKSSAVVAEFSRKKAEEFYGCTRPFGYVYGGSGGGYKTMAAIENTRSWDGAVPFVIGSPVSLPNTIMLHVQGQRALRRVFGLITDRVDAGGDIEHLYDGLTEDEAFMLREITDMGFSPTIWYSEAHGRIDDGALPVLMPLIHARDQSYFTDSWTVPGYLGADPSSSAVKDRLQFETVVKAVHLPGEPVASRDMDDVDGAWKKMLTDGSGAWIEVESVPEGENLYIKGVNITFPEGEAKEYTLLLDRIEGNCLLIGSCYGMDDLPGALSKVHPGDRVHLDNSDYIAAQSYYRHQVPEDPSFHAWDQFRDAEGHPTLPQRSTVFGPGMTGTGTVQDGQIQGNVIVVQALNDESTCPWCADWYRGKVAEAGNAAKFRLYYNDHCMHGNTEKMENTMVTNYLGVLRQSLLDVAAWVEEGKEPCPTTNYEVDGGRISVTKSGGERGGLQPAAVLLANGRTAAHVKVGETVNFSLSIGVPEGAGEVTRVDYGFADDWDLPAKDPFPVPGTFERTNERGVHGAVSYISHVFDTPGTHFVTARFMSNKNGDAADDFTQCRNLARVRVIVEE